MSKFGCLEVGSTSFIAKKPNYIKIEFQQKSEDENFCKNWSNMSYSERKRFIENMPDSNHKKIIKKELEQSGLL